MGCAHGPAEEPLKESSSGRQCLSAPEEQDLGRCACRQNPQREVPPACVGAPAPHCRRVRLTEALYPRGFTLGSAVERELGTSRCNKASVGDWVALLALKSSSARCAWFEPVTRQIYDPKH